MVPKEQNHGSAALALASSHVLEHKMLDQTVLFVLTGGGTHGEKYVLSLAPKERNQGGLLLRCRARLASYQLQVAS